MVNELSVLMRMLMRTQGNYALREHRCVRNDWRHCESNLRSSRRSVNRNHLWQLHLALQGNDVKSLREIGIKM